MDVVIFAVPPGLPLVLMLIGAVAQSVLLKAGVLLLRPEIVRPGAVIDMVCFDKTGTLTSSMVSEPLKYMSAAPSEQCFDLCEAATDLQMSLVCPQLTGGQLRHKHSSIDTVSAVHLPELCAV